MKSLHSHLQPSKSIIAIVIGFIIVIAVSIIIGADSTQPSTNAPTGFGTSTSTSSTTDSSVASANEDQEYTTTTKQPSLLYSLEELALVDMLNCYRLSKGVQPLLISDILTVAAERHNADMSSFGFLSHTTKASAWFDAGALPSDRMKACGYDFHTWMGENIAAGCSTAKAVFEALLGSKTHREVMLSSKLSVIGLSLDYYGGSDWGWYCTMDFGGHVDESAHDLHPNKEHTR